MLFLGRIHRKKGCDLLIDSFIKLASLDPGLHLVMAGPDQQNWSADLQAQVAAAGLTPRVHWPGMLHGDVKWGALCAAECFILPSHQENFGIAVAEALACSRPVLLADKVNIAPEIAADGAGLMQPDTPEGTDTLLRTWIDMSPASPHHHVPPGSRNLRQPLRHAPQRRNHHPPLRPPTRELTSTVLCHHPLVRQSRSL